MALVREMGWDNHKAPIISVPVTRNGKQVNINLIDEFGGFTLQELREHMLTYYSNQTIQA